MAVENPMSLVITSDTTIGVTLEASVPTTETFLYNKTIELSDTLLDEISVTIPNGVNVLYISSHAESSEGYDDYVSVEIINLNNQKSWRYRQEGYNFFDQWYVGVTPGKTYRLQIYLGAEYNLSGGYVKISYSQSINTKTPNTTDY